MCARLEWSLEDLEGTLGVGGKHREVKDDFLKNQKHTGAARCEITKQDNSGAFKERSLSSVLQVLDGSSAQS